jgi:hypothetical protein
MTKKPFLKVRNLSMLLRQFSMSVQMNMARCHAI